MAMPSSHDLLTNLRTRVTSLGTAVDNILTALGITGAIENAVQDAVLESQAILSHLEAPLTDVGWVAEGASDAIAVGWESIAVTVPADSRKLGMFEVHVDTPGVLATLDFCWTHDAVGRYRITNNETLTVGAPTLNPDGATYSWTGSFGDVSNKRPSFGAANTIWFWHRGNAAAGNVVPVIHGEL